MRQKLPPRGSSVFCLPYPFILLRKRCIDAYTGYAVRGQTSQADTPKLVFEVFHKFYSEELVPEVGLCAPGPLQELATNDGPPQELTDNSVMEALLDVDGLRSAKNAKYTKAFRTTFPALFDTVGRGCTGDFLWPGADFFFVMVQSCSAISLWTI